MAELELNIEAKKLLLFISKHNILWRSILSNHVTQNKIAEFMGTNSSNLSNWKKTGRYDEALVEACFDNISKNIELLDDSPTKKQEYKDILDQFIKSYRNSDEKVYETAKKCEINLEQCQRIIDDLIYSSAPLFPHLYLDSAGQARKFCDAYKGVYYAFVKRNGHWFQASLRVRYSLLIQGLPAIRVKLNIPKLGKFSEVPYWEYDGFVRELEKRLFWIFEKRQPTGRDFFTIVTKQGVAHRAVEGTAEKLLTTLWGNYLTVGQDSRDSIVTGDIILQKIDLKSKEEYKNEEKSIYAMHHTKKDVSNEQANELEKIVFEMNKEGGK